MNKGQITNVSSGTDFQVFLYNHYSIDSQLSVNVCIFNPTPGSGVDKLYPQELESADIIHPQRELQRHALQRTMQLPIGLEPYHCCCVSGSRD